MGMFDSVKAVNIAHEEFKHNNESFQTKDLACDCSDYVIFNGRLWKQYDAETGEYLEAAQDIEYNGQINIYTEVTIDKITAWIDYNLTFKDGLLCDVVRSERITKDERDLSANKPFAPSNRMNIKIDISDLDEQRQSEALAVMDDALDVIRKCLNNPDATIVHPVKSQAAGVYSLASTASPVRYVTSVVQRMSDIEDAIKKAKPIKSASGDSVTLIVDEASSFFSK